MFIQDLISKLVETGWIGVILKEHNHERLAMASRATVEVSGTGAIDP